jgi:hypothetical protein
MHDWLSYVLFKWQLSNDVNLVPETYNGGLRLLATGEVVQRNLDDPLTYYKNVTARETFQRGYGELCSIHDQLIEPMNLLLKNKEPKELEAIRRLRVTLPPELLEFYYPKIAENNLTFFDYVLSEVGNCNPISKNCKPMPIALKYNDTKTGRRQYKAFIEAGGFDVTPYVVGSEEYYYQFMSDLYKYNYCSPYVV